MEKYPNSEAERIIMEYEEIISTDPDDDTEMSVIDVYRDDAINEAIKTKKSGNADKARYLMGLIKKADEKFMRMKDKIKKVFADESDVMDAVESIEEDILDTDYNI